MRRKVFALTALLALLVCGVAYAATKAPDKITASVSAKANGSAKKPAVTSVTEKFGIKNASKGDAWPATNINVTIGNLKTENANSYPKCTTSQIKSPHWNAACPSSSEVATGTVSATLYNAGHPTAGGAAPCKLDIGVYNAGQGKLTFFLYIGKGDVCAYGALVTGDAKPWTATYKESGSSMVMNVPLPADVSTQAGGLNLWAAINSETLNFKKIDVKNKPVIVSTGCKANKRSDKFTFSIRDGSKTVKQSVSGSSSC